ncbi:hypothetical protein, partial [Pseudomonas sp. Q11]|uniref:hypothetical protein n=1 Tax=Pseudomonas sp. Q11 TaxID=2968470 RepID=UPI00210DEAA1
GPASGFSKVSRRQGGTLSSRYRSNGYAHSRLEKGEQQKKRRFSFLKQAPFFLSEQHYAEAGLFVRLIYLDASTTPVWRLLRFLAALY